jgi:hypothetical protein
MSIQQYPIQITEKTASGIRARTNVSLICATLATDRAFQQSGRCVMSGVQDDQAQPGIQSRQQDSGQAAVAAADTENDGDDGGGRFRGKCSLCPFDHPRLRVQEHAEHASTARSGKRVSAFGTLCPISQATNGRNLLGMQNMQQHPGATRT